MRKIIAHHLHLHRTRFERASIEFGLSPTVSYVLLVIIFLGFSFMLLSRGSIEQWTYSIIPLVIISLISNPNRLRFDRQIYSDQMYKRINLMEKLIITIPFVICLIVFGALIPAIVITGISILVSFDKIVSSSTLVIPTPFYKFPFEFASGFRWSWILILGLYTLAFIAISVDNSALALFSLGMLALHPTMYYNFPESEYFVWIHSMSSRSFLIHKIKIAIAYTCLLTFPLMIIVMITWPSFVAMIVLGLVVALLYIATFIVAKYSFYPNIFNLPIAIALAVSLLTPPLLLILFPYLFQKAANNLKSTLS